MDETHATDADQPTPDSPSAPDRPADLAILHALDTTHAMPIAELTSTVDADPATVDHLCHRLRSAGYVRARTDGSYSITAHGEQYLRTLLRQRRIGP
ncbi:winged helix-turn-helix domain-containing protein [Haloarchaeobius sp. FL176]|uniref:winged helix-turn-helix domain-containing protein n=1 Tax=Haloarchaeobius sp. FL176 TaxID=2967129 RepID=UPI002147610D|nr:winged helix-turn-helix domain-containing protein [Haloarchaeobius sp. FL176]